MKAKTKRKTIRAAKIAAGVAGAATAAIGLAGAGHVAYQEHKKAKNPNYTPTYDRAWKKEQARIHKRQVK